jgi:hypothetical protein
MNQRWMPEPWQECLIRIGEGQEVLGMCLAHTVDGRLIVHAPLHYSSQPWYTSSSNVRPYNGVVLK